MADYQFKGEVNIPLMDATLKGLLAVPRKAKGLIVFSHGSGSSRHSPRNRLVAERLEEARYATLLFDLLTEAEEGDSAKRFEIDLLTERLVEVTDWLKSQEKTADLAIGYFGASTGAAAALNAAANLGELVSAVVSRGGRPDMASPMLSSVTAPTLLIVGKRDTQVIEVNEQALAEMRSQREIRIIDGAGHLFEEEGKLEQVADLAVSWFDKYVITKQEEA